MRVVSGRLRGRHLSAPARSGTRPTSDRVREALFSHLEARLSGLEDLRVLDAFAGTGALGIEAISRGAASCLFIESDRATAEVARSNFEHCGLTEEAARLRVGNSFVLAGRIAREGPFDLILLDPPYATPPAEVLRFVDALSEAGALGPEAYLVYEHQRDRPIDWPGWYHGQHTARYGKTWLSCAFSGEEHRRV
ncbi:MAG: 16S rRNA (guanine(966)-N(2))-methyltransferase RsmD [Actinomycetia bacterium]|nr:16S rRNA (guanine(966)-N(2))-methyltransferase RsmD [Actinomycetes bacterium]